MENMGDRIRRLRTNLGLTQAELGEKVGLQRAAINKYEKGETENMKRTIIGKMSKIFNVSPSYLMAFDDLDIEDYETSETITLPFFGSVPAGNFEQPSAVSEKINVPASIVRNEKEKYFVLRANGDSMNKVIANDHYVVVQDLACSDNSSLKTNDIVIARNGSEYTMKRIRKTDTMVHLEPDSYIDEFEIQSFKIEELSELVIIGKVIYSFREF